MYDNNMPQIKSLSNLLWSFEANIGQKDELVKFLTRGKGYTAFFTPTEVVLTLVQDKAEDRPINKREDFMNHNKKEPLEKQSIEHNILRMKMEGANPDTEIIGEEILEGKINYFIGNDPEKWVTDVPTYEKVRYQEIYPGIDLLYYGKSRQLEHDFIVKPGSDPGKINLSFEGSEKIEIDDGGNLLIQAKKGDLKLLKPVAYQNINGTQQEIESFYEIRENGNVGFLLGEYDRDATLKIDPVLVYSTFLGGSNFDWDKGIAVDSAGSAYVTGFTYSSDFPTTTGAYDITSNGVDAFVTKLNASGTELIYSTFLGGTEYEEGKGIAIDTAGNAYVTGLTNSSDFPTTAGAYDTTYNGNGDVFVTKLNASGTGLIYSTFLGGIELDLVYGIAVDSVGNAYAAGLTTSSDFPTTVGAYDTTFTGTGDAFVTELNASGTGLVYSTFLGGVNVAEAQAIAVDEAGNAYVTGLTNSSDFPTTVGAYDTTFNGGDYDAFVTKLNDSGSGLIYSTFLGGSDYDWGNGIAVDELGNAYVTGSTRSSDFPTTADAYDTIYNGTGDAFVTKLNASGTGLIYSTFLGGVDYEEAFGIAVNDEGNAYVIGYTYSSDFPTTAGAYDTTYNGNGDVFVTKLNAGGTGLIYSTFLGGSDFEWGSGIALDSAGNAYVTGLTNSSDFPTTAGAYDTTYNGNGDAFVTKFSFVPSVPDCRLVV